VWTEHVEFLGQVKSYWNFYWDYNLIDNLSKKVHYLKRTLQALNKDTFGNIFKEEKVILEQIRILESNDHLDSMDHEKIEEL
jgi:hypothetical protein